MWKVRAIRGAITVPENTVSAIREAVMELLAAIETQNQLDPAEIVNVIFTTTPDLDAIFPAAIARERPHWEYVPLLDVQQMHVPNSLPRCIRILIQVNTRKPQAAIVHAYLRAAKVLRPDLSKTSVPAKLPFHEERETDRWRASLSLIFTRTLDHLFKGGKSF